MALQGVQVRKSGLVATLGGTLLVLVGCGSTSQVKPAASSEAVAAAPAPTMDIRSFDRLVVMDFTDATDKGAIKQKDLEAYNDTVATATRTYADLIAQKLKATGAFAAVERNASANSGEGRTLLLSGRITRLKEGNAAARLLVGFGAGSSYFDATTTLTDAGSQTQIGTIVTDKNSWALGGAIAATQNVHSFMNGAADKIARELSDLKNGKTDTVERK